MTQISVFRTSEQELNAWLTSAVPRNSSRSGGLIKTPEVEPITRFAYHPSIQRKKRTRAAKRRTFRDFN
jgi:hypothetical protein